MIPAVIEALVIGQSVVVMLLEVVVVLGTLDEVEVGWVPVLVGLTLVLAGRGTFEVPSHLLTLVNALIRLSLLKLIPRVATFHRTNRCQANHRVRRMKSVSLMRTTIRH